MSPESRPIKMLDDAPSNDRFRRDVLSGLKERQKQIPCKYLYDERGSELFERICDLDEYYLTRTELAIMEDHVGEMASAIGPGCLLIEYGSGSSRKTRLLLDKLQEPVGYVPIDISPEALANSAEQLRKAYPSLEILPVCADYTVTFRMPVPTRPAARRVVYFPGSTLGNFNPEESRDFLGHVVTVVGLGGGLLIGVDLKKDAALLEAAYNDREGVTAAFNKNLLVRINRELDADFDPGRFRHRAVYNHEKGRVESYLVSRTEQTIHIGGEAIKFKEGETIYTESSHKYDLQDFRALASGAGLEVQQVWTDAGQLFSVQYLTAA